MNRETIVADATNNAGESTIDSKLGGNQPKIKVEARTNPRAMLPEGVLEGHIKRYKGLMRKQGILSICEALRVARDYLHNAELEEEALRKLYGLLEERWSKTPYLLKVFRDAIGREDLGQGAEERGYCPFMQAVHPPQVRVPEPVNPTTRTPAYLEQVVHEQPVLAPK